MKLYFLLLLIITNSFTFFMCYFVQLYSNERSKEKDYVRVQSPLDSKFLQEKDVAPESEVEVPSEDSSDTPPPPPPPPARNCSAAKERVPSEPVTIDKQKLVSCGKQNLSNKSASADAHLLTTIIAITPTYGRRTQKVDLVSLCQTIMHVHNLLWLVIEDSKTKSSLVQNLLLRCNVNSVHLNVATTRQTKKAVQRGVEQRNAGLDWARRYCRENCNNLCNGVIYFMDDDNKYDLRVFEEMRKTKTLSVFPVAFSGGLAFEGPICEDGKAVAWQAVWQSKERHIPVDMAAFAIHVSLIINKPEVKVGFQPGGKRRSKRGFMESDLIKSIGRSREEIECRGVLNEVLVWHVKTTKPFLSYKSKYPEVEV